MLRRLTFCLILFCALTAFAQSPDDPFSYTIKDRDYRNAALGIHWKAPRPPAEASVLAGDHATLQRLREQNRKDSILLRSYEQRFFANPNHVGCCSSRGDASLSFNGNPAGPSYYAPGEFRVSISRLAKDSAPCDLLNTRLTAEASAPKVRTEILSAPLSEDIGGQTFCRADWKARGQASYPIIYVATFVTVRHGYALTWEFRADSPRELRATTKSMAKLSFD